jgi:hypothetical protein
MPAPALLMKMLPMMMGQSGGQGGGGGMQGAGLPMAIGGAQLIQGHIQRAKAKKMQPAQEDAQQVTAMQEYQRRANNAMTGANISNQMRDLAQMQGAGVKALSRGGNLGQYAQLGRIQGNALNNILAQGQEQEQSYRTMFNDMLKTVADRRMRVQSKAADAMSKRSEQNVAAGTQGIMAGMAKMGGGKSANTGAEIGTKGTSGSSFGPQSMNMEQITAAGNAPIMGFGGMPLGI